jgi:hypothetical protein
MAADGIYFPVRSRAARSWLLDIHIGTERLDA